MLTHPKDEGRKSNMGIPILWSSLKVYLRNIKNRTDENVAA